MNSPDEARASSAGDRAVAIAGFLAILLTGFFGDDPDVRSQPAPAPSKVDWNAREEIKRIDTRKCRVSLLTGEYHYSCMPAMAEAVAASIPGARMTIMKGMGHFPMVENYAAFRPFLLSELSVMEGAAQIR